MSFIVNDKGNTTEDIAAAVDVVGDHPTIQGTAIPLEDTGMDRADIDVAEGVTDPMMILDQIMDQTGVLEVTGRDGEDMILIITGGRIHIIHIGGTATMVMATATATEDIQIMVKVEVRSSTLT